jgi:hypothetical protein
MMISAKTLSGDIITFNVSTEKDFENLYKEKYIKQKYRAYVSVIFVDNYENKEKKESICNLKNMLVNVNDMPIFIEEFYRENLENNKSKNIMINHFCLNQDPKAIDILKSIVDDFSDIFFIYSNNKAFSIIKDLIENNRDPLDELIFINLAKNTSDDSLDLIKTFDITNFTYEILDELCYNPNPKAFDFIMENIDYIESLTRRNNEMLFYLNLCNNPKTIDFLIKNQHLINWTILSENPSAMNLLLKNPLKIDHKGLCANNHIEAIKIILSIFKKEGFNSDKINYFKLFSNDSLEMVYFLNENFHCINTMHINNNIDVICRNKSAMCIIEKIYKLGYKLSNSIWTNESIFRDNDEDIYL